MSKKPFSGKDGENIRGGYNPDSKGSKKRPTPPPKPPAKKKQSKK